MTQPSSVSDDLCPFCENRLRESDSGYAKCPSCKVVFYKHAKVVSYEEDYFHKEYEAQYGRSYLEDRESIAERMRERLMIAKRYFPRPRALRLLEVGSAAGFFLELAEQEGIQCTGWEISEIMSDYARGQGLQCVTGNFNDLFQEWSASSAEPFDILAFFYVAEHFPDQRAFWENVSRLLAPGGLLLLSLPSTFGPMYFFLRRTWLETHPTDHFADYSPAALKNVGRRFGFSPLHFSSESLHPDRFPGGRLPAVKSVAKLIQKTIPFADTLYAVLRKNDSNFNDNI